MIFRMHLNWRTARGRNDSGDVIVNLLAAKTRVAPIKQVSLSRLKLNATALLSTLMESILQAFNHLEVEPWEYTGESQEELLEESLK